MDSSTPANRPSTSNSTTIAEDAALDTEEYSILDISMLCPKLEVTTTDVGAGGQLMPKAIDIPDDTLAQMTVKELNRKKLGTAEVAALKQRRRTLKNRGYAFQCRLRHQQYKDSLEMEVQQLREQLKKCEDERNFFREFYLNCCGARHPLSLEMANSNNHEAGDYERQNAENMKIDPVDFPRDFNLNSASRADNTGKLEPDEPELAEELLAAGEDPTALGVIWRKERGGGSSIRVSGKIKKEENTETRWKSLGNGVPAHCKEERKESKSGMGKQPYIPDKTLAKLTVKELKKKMQNLGTEEVTALKQRRRTLKNRGYAVQCRLRRQQYKDSLEMQVQKEQEQLKKCEDELRATRKERDVFRQCYHKWYGQRLHPNLEMVDNNEHEAEDFKRQDGEDMKIDPEDFQRYFDLNGGYRGNNTGKLWPDQMLR